jgi:hypothetical protein
MPIDGALGVALVNRSSGMALGGPDVTVGVEVGSFEPADRPVLWWPTAPARAAWC